MRRLSETQWRLVLKSVRVIGVTGCVLSFVLLVALIGYYSANRPHAPHPGSGWTVPLPWTGWPRAYGTAQENSVIHRMHLLFFPFFVLIATAFAMEKYQPERFLYLIVGLAAAAGSLLMLLSMS
jgi:hypothetical protein